MKDQFIITIECFKCNKKVTSQGAVLQNLKSLSYELKFHSPTDINFNQEVYICEQCNNEYKIILKENEKRKLDFFTKKE